MSKLISSVYLIGKVGPTFNFSNGVSSHGYRFCICDDALFIFIFSFLFSLVIHVGLTVEQHYKSTFESMHVEYVYIFYNFY